MARFAVASFDLDADDGRIAGDALTRHLLGRTDQGGEGLADVRTLYGSTTKAQTSAMARELARSPEYEGSHRYTSTRRRLERYEPGAGERRRPNPALVGLLRKLGLTRKAEPIRTDGLLMRIRAQITVSKTARVHTMPARGYQRIEGAALGDVADAWIVGRVDDAGDFLIRAFFAAYELEPVDVGPVEWVELRAGGAQ